MVVIENSEALREAVEAFSNARVLCIGDAILDHFVYGETNRISPEAPVPVLAISNDIWMLGGAGNVVRNLCALDASVTFISVVGDDEAGKRFTKLASKESKLEPFLLVEKGRMTSEKTRFISGHQQLLRADSETTKPIQATTEKALLTVAEKALKDVDILVISDYAKGLLTDKILSTLIKDAKHLPVFVDPKRKDLSMYEGATLISPNQHELLTSAAGENADSVEEAAIAVMKRHHFSSILVTRGKNGMTLLEATKAPLHLATEAKEVYDVSGAGDTVIATLAAAYASGATLAHAAYLANLAAGIVVGRVGTSVIDSADIKGALLTKGLTSGTRKVMPENLALEHIDRWKKQGYSIGFTNGCFDLLHPGHISLLEQAKSSCDRLVVALNSDASVKRLKGKDRPVQNELSRSSLLASLEPVDLVMIFTEDTPLRLIKTIRPDVLVKGADYTKDKVVGADEVESYGGKIMLAKLSDGQSTTAMIGRMGKK